MKVVAVSGYFNPIHIGHLDMIEAAKKLGDKLVVIINNDEQVKLKGSVPFMPIEERVRIVAALRDVDEVVVSVDAYKEKSGEVPICKTLAMVNPDIFGNGGDRPDEKSIPEAGVCQEFGIEMVFGLGQKIQSSSVLIQKAVEHKVKKA